MLFEAIKDCIAQVHIAIDELDTLQDGRDIVTRAGLELQVLDWDLAEGKLGALNHSHRCLSNEYDRKSRRNWQIRAESGDIRRQNLA